MVAALLALYAAWGSPAVVIPWMLPILMMAEPGRMTLPQACAAPIRAVEVDVDYVAELLRCIAGRRVRSADASVIDQHINAAEFGDRAVDHGL